MSDVAVIEGIGEVYAAKLKAAGIGTTKKLLVRGATRAGRRKIEDDSGIGDTLILRWVNHLDLFRIRGVAAQYAELLEACGVDSVPELSHRVPENLHARMVEVNEQRRMVRKLPTLAQVACWVEEAKELPRIVTH